MSADFITRFAPSPTGRLHLGHAASAFEVWRIARAHDGQVLLRIEDIDTSRCRPEFTAAILEDLHWLGLNWDGPVRRQSEHFADYAASVEALRQRGLAYRCFRTRSELAELTGPDGVFTGGPISADEEAMRIGRGDVYAWRLSLAAVRQVLGTRFDAVQYTVGIGKASETLRANPGRHGDIILARKDSPSAYHLAACHDDELQGVTHVIRGEDLIDAPHIHSLLQVLMGWRQPIYHHHALILDADGRKLSKRAGSISLAALRADGMTAEQIRRHLGY